MRVPGWLRELPPRRRLYREAWAWLVSHRPDDEAVG